MPPVGAAIAAIAAAAASVTAAVISAVSAVIAAIAGAIAVVAAFLATTIGSLLVTIGTTIWAAMQAVGSIVVSLAAKTYAVIAKAVTAIVAQGLSVITAIWSGIKSVVGTISGFLSSVLGTITNIVTPVFTHIKNIVGSISGWIRTAIGEIKRIYAVVKASTFGKIVKAVKELSDVLSVIHTIAQSYVAFSKNRPLEGIYILAMKFDSDLASAIKTTSTYIESQLSAIIKEMSSVFDLIRKDITSLSGYAAYMGRILGDIGKAFDVKGLENIASGIREFNEKTLLKIRNEINDAKKDLQSWTAEQLHPIYDLIRQVNLADREYKQYQRVFNYLSLRHLSYGMTGYKSSKRLLIPVIER